MKKRSSHFLVYVLSFVFSWGVGGICFADNAAEVVIQVSYPSGEDYVTFYNGVVGDIDDTETDHYVNVHITLLDANGEPATLGPDGDPLSVVEATLTTELGVKDSIVENQFLSGTATMTFDVTDVGPAAKAHVRYACQTGCKPGRDTLEVTVDSLTASAEVSVLDTKNGVSTSCTITIEPPMGIEVSPDPMLRSRWIGLWHLMTIKGANTSFVSFSTTVSFDPDSAVFELPPLVLGPEEIWQLVQVNPPWIAGTEEDQTVTVTVTTDGEEVTGAFQVEMLPSPLDE